MRWKLYSWLAIFFVVTQALGVLVASEYLVLGKTMTIITDDPNDPINAIGLIGFILFYTGVFLVFMKFFKKRFFRVMESLAVFTTSWIVIDALIPEMGLMFAILLIAIRLAFKENIWLKNLASVFAVAGAGSLIGISMGIMPVLLFIFLLSIYDLIAVFKTKHMVTMAKAIISENLAFTFTIPTKDHSFQLGTGDLVIPLVFSVAVFAVAMPHGFWVGVSTVLPILIASIAGLIGTMHIAAEKKIALPALPMQSAFMILVWGAMFLAGMPVL